MYAVSLTSSPVITVTSPRHRVDFATDGSHMNPLEGFYATLAGCAGVYAKKACKELGIAADGIEIRSKPFTGTGGPLTLGKFVTEMRFPDQFTAEQRERIMASVAQCAVKKIVAEGASVSFQVVEAAA